MKEKKSRTDSAALMDELEQHTGRMLECVEKCLVLFPD